MSIDNTSSFCIYMKIYAKGDVFLRKKIIIILMMAMLVGIVAGSQMLGERLYAQVDENTEEKSKGTNSAEGAEGEPEAGTDTAGNTKEKPEAGMDSTGNTIGEPEASTETAGNAEAGENQSGETKNAGAENENKQTEGALVILDAGHGGVDPGKIGINGALEKDVNLAVAQKAKKYLEEQGLWVIMTRENAGALSDSKVEDLKARVALINEKSPSIAVSIHQNSYSQESVHGAQVFYYTHSKGGEEAAKILQTAMLEIDPENKRQAKANDTYYLLKKTKETTVIVECGFLSNQKEADLLITEEYQDKVAASVAKGVQEYLSSFTL